MININETYAVLAYEAVTVAAAAVGFTTTYLDHATYGHCRAVFCTLETAQIRFRLDGTDPTSSEGHLLEAGQTLTLENPGDIKNFSAIRTGANSGTLRVSYRY